MIDKSLNQFDPSTFFVNSRHVGFGQGLDIAFKGTAALSITVHDNLHDISQIWIKFQTHAACTVYQTYQWCNAWQETVGREYGCSPRILMARDQLGKVIFILPLQIRKRNGVKILEWHGYPSINYGYGLFDQFFLRDAGPWFSENLARILEYVGPFDALALQDMPEKMNGNAHPLHNHFRIKAANRSYAMKIQPDFDALYTAKRSPETRRSNRKKDAKLVAIGGLKFGLPATPEEAHCILDTMFVQKKQRLAESGVYGVFEKAERDFIHSLVGETNGGKALLLPYTLICNEKVLAVILAIQSNNSCWLMISSLGSGDVRKFSPGDYVLRHMIEDCCRQGFGRIDFAAGDAVYKSQWAEETISLYTTLHATNWRGLVWVLGAAAVLASKRLIKQTPVLHNSAMFLRRVIAGKKSN